MVKKINPRIQEYMNLWFLSGNPLKSDSHKNVNYRFMGITVSYNLIVLLLFRACGHHDLDGNGDGYDITDIMSLQGI